MKPRPKILQQSSEIRLHLKYEPPAQPIATEESLVAPPAVLINFDIHKDSRWILL